jgi:hypothetical protein
MLINTGLRSSTVQNVRVLFLHLAEALQCCIMLSNNDFGVTACHMIVKSKGGELGRRFVWQLRLLKNYMLYRIQILLLWHTQSVCSKDKLRFRLEIKNTNIN